MKWVKMVETFDGKQHDNYLVAERHLDELYGAELTKIAHELCRCDGNYKKTLDWLDTNLDRFKPLHVIKNDMVLEREEDHDDYHYHPDDD